MVDREEGIAYRIVVRLDATDGWAPTSFWQSRWDVDHKAICSFVERGWLDAAIEVSSQVRRYRCRDEGLVFESEEYKKQRRRAAVTKSNSKRLKWTPEGYR